MKAEKILFVTQEIDPYVPKSNLTCLGHELPLLSLDQGREIRAFMPKWGGINERRNQLHPVQRISGMNLIVNDTDYQLILKVASVVGTRMQVYFIDEEEFFGKRTAECDREGKEYTDNATRAVFYARAVLETVKKMRWMPDVVHCQGWISSLVPVYLKTAYADDPCFRNCKIVYTVTDNKLTLPTGDDFGNIVAFRNADGNCFKEFGTSLTPVNLLKFAIKYSDGVTFTSTEPNPEVVTYAKEQNKIIMDAPTDVLTDYTELFDKVWSAGAPTTPEE